MCAVAAVNIASGLILAEALPARDRAVALALAFALSYAAGAAICFRLLSQRLDGVEAKRVTRTVVRAAVAGVVAAGIAYALCRILRSAIGEGVTGSLVGVLVGALVGGALYTVAAWRMTEELRAVSSMIGGRFRGR
jgi:putative peptidoglycan lipid II flippase